MKGKNVEYVKFVLTSRGPSPMVGKTTNTSESIPGEDVIIEDNRSKRIKYVPREASIYFEEQYQKDAPPQSIEFLDGSLMVPSSDTMLLDYLRKTNWNKSNPNRDNTAKALYEEFNIDALSKTQLEKEELIMKAEGILYTMSDDRIRSVSRVALPHHEFSNLESTPSALKLRLKRWISANRHRQFIELSTDPVVDRVEKVVNAEEMGVIAFTRSAWFYNNEAFTKILEVPSSQDKYRFLAEKSFEAVKKDWIVISRALDDVLADRGDDDVDPNSQQTTVLADVATMKPVEFFKALKENELVKWEKSRRQFCVVEENGELGLEIGGSSDDAVDFATQNEELRNSLRKRLSIALQKKG